MHSEHKKQFIQEHTGIISLKLSRVVGKYEVSTSAQLVNLSVMTYNNATDMTEAMKLLATVSGMS